MAVDPPERRSRSGPVSALSPECRILSLALLSSASLLASWPFAASIAAAAMLLLKLHGRSMLRILGDSILPLAFALLTFALKCLGSPAGLGEAGPGGTALIEEAAIAAAVFGVKLLSALLLGSLLYASTSLSEIRDASTRIIRPIPLLGKIDAGLSLSLILSFIPILRDEWRESSLAMRSRARYRAWAPRQASRFLMSFLRRSMLRAVELPLALMARGWHARRGLPDLEWKIADSILLASSFLLLAAAALRLV